MKFGYFGFQYNYTKKAQVMFMYLRYCLLNVLPLVCFCLLQSLNDNIFLRTVNRSATHKECLFIKENFNQLPQDAADYLFTTNVNI